MFIYSPYPVLQALIWLFKWVANCFRWLKNKARIWAPGSCVGLIDYTKKISMYIKSVLPPNNLIYWDILYRERLSLFFTFIILGLDSLIVSFIGSSSLVSILYLSNNPSSIIRSYKKLTNGRWSTGGCVRRIILLETVSYPFFVSREVTLIIIIVIPP